MNHLSKVLVGLACLLAGQGSVAGTELSAGVWWVYQDAAGGPAEFTDPALIIYAADDGSHGPWGFSAEMRIGTGSFTDPASNNSNDNFTLHKGWISYQLDSQNKLTLGKSQVPFGWKTSNFWPGDMLQGGYGDQMDVGLKLSGSYTALGYDLAYYHQDDWGSTSTDTVDDNGHWGSSASYRKVKTFVGNLDWHVVDEHTLGLSLQSGKLQDLAQYDATGKVDNDGDHYAGDLHYYFSKAGFDLKYRFIYAERDFSALETCITATLCPDAIIKTRRHALHLGYSHGPWAWYLESTTAKTDTDGNASDSVRAFAPGVRYQYGPGWIYLEYLWQNGFIDSFGDVGEGDFKSLYVSFDFYF